jgi:hypothetical protein
MIAEENRQSQPQFPLFPSITFPPSFWQGLPDLGSTTFS